MLVIDPRSAIPPFEQVRAQIVELVRTGGLQADARLPTVRKLAADLGIAPNTVARTYRELERAGVVITRGRHGTFIAADTHSDRQRVENVASAFAREARAARLSDDDAIELVKRALKSDRA
ncbi:GntR family transcriptional regulator [Cryobacterium breve]|uniref:GntR family transcriptional regulator n=1 Tax=Cryobacterium breve TaxID=1259258 RepID=A0ABY7NEH5_9MICO|nr:GntR family transcriptional regulator [Cryobacterium breve]WBM79964.1 GntR family transcriptional regulator [Cryobacterium breve]